MYAISATLYEQVAIDRQDHKKYSIAAHYYKCATICYKETDNTIKYTEMLEKALLLYEQIATEYNDIKDFQNAVIYYRSAADCCKQLDDKSRAIELYTKTIELYNECGNIQTAAHVQSIITSLEEQFHHTISIDSEIDSSDSKEQPSITNTRSGYSISRIWNAIIGDRTTETR